MTELKQDMLLEIQRLEALLAATDKLRAAALDMATSYARQLAAHECKHAPVVVMMPDEIKTSGPYIEVTDFRVDCKLCGSQLKSKGWEKL